MGEDSGISAATAWAYFDRVSAYLQYCQEWKIIRNNLAQTAVAKAAMPDRQSSSSANRQFWTPEQRHTLTQYVDRKPRRQLTKRGRDSLAAVRNQALVYLLGYSGVCGSEVLLLWGGRHATAGSDFERS